MALAGLALLVLAPGALAARVSLDGPATARVGGTAHFTVTLSGMRSVGGFEARVIVDGRAMRVIGGATRSGKGIRTLGPTESARGLHLGFFGANLGGRKVRVAQFGLRVRQPGRIRVRLVDIVAVDRAGRRVALRSTSTLVKAGRSKKVWSAAAVSSTTTRKARGVGADITGDRIVDAGDVMEVVFGITTAREGDIGPCRAPRDADVNGDGCVDVADGQRVVLMERRSKPQPAAKRTRAHGVPWVVNSTSDDDDAVPGDGICATAAGVCSLRAAVDEANRHRGDDEIHFNIPGPGPHTIRVLRNFAHINSQNGRLVIDGYTQPGAQPNTHPTLSNADIRIQIQGPMPNSRGTSIQRVNGPFISSSNNVIRGLAIFGFYRMLWISGPNAQNNKIVGNFIGLGARSTNWTPAPTGLYTNGGLMIDAAARNVIGTPALEDRNVISGTYGSGVYLTHTGSDHNVVQNNIIGLSPTADRQVRNHSHGVDLNFGSKWNTIGGTGPNEGNVLSGNIETGIELSHGYNSDLPPDADTSEPYVLRGNRIVGNLIGLMPDGTSTTYARNTGDSRLEGAIHLEDYIYETYIAHNWMVHNRGAMVTANNHVDDSVVEHNTFGVGPGGNAAFAQDWGVSWRGTSSGNIVRFNDFRNTAGGVWIHGASVRNRVSQNSMTGLADLGIDLNRDGVTPGGGGGSGANTTIALPTSVAATTARVTGNACGNCTIEVFRSSGAAGGYGPGGTYIGSTTSAGNGTWTFTVPPGALQAGDLVTTTATTAVGNTSEFSLNVAVGEGPPPDAPVAQDGFARTVSNGWGSAPTGGAYSLFGAAADYAVANGAGTMRMNAGTTREAWLGSVSIRDFDSSVRYSTDKAPAAGNVWVYLVGRRIPNGAQYRANIRMAPSGTVYAQVTRYVGGAEEAVGGAVAVPGVTHAPGTQIRVRMRVTGANPTTIAITVWADGQPEPSPQVTRTDSEPSLQTAGAPGLRAYTGSATSNAPVVARFSDWLVRPVVP